MSNKRDRFILQINKLNKKKEELYNQINNDIYSIKEYVKKQNLEKDEPKPIQISYERHRNVKLKEKPSKKPITVVDIIKSLDILEELDKQLIDIDIDRLIISIKETVNYESYQKIINEKNLRIEEYQKEIKILNTKINEYKKRIFNNDEDICNQKKKEDIIKEKEISRILSCVENINCKLLENLENKVNLKYELQNKMNECKNNICLYEKEISNLSLVNLDSRKKTLNSLKLQKKNKKNYYSEIKNINEQLKVNERNINSCISQLKNLRIQYTFNSNMKFILKKKINKLENEKNYLLMFKKEIEDKYNKSIDRPKIVRKNVLLDLKQKLNQNISNKNNLQKRLENFNEVDINSVYLEYDNDIHNLNNKYLKCIERQEKSYSRLNNKREINLRDYNSKIEEFKKDIEDINTLIDIYNNEINYETIEYNNKNEIFVKLCDKLVKLQEKKKQYQIINKDITLLNNQLSKY